MLPAAVAVSVVMPDVPPILKTPVAPLIIPPIPARDVVAVTVLLLVSLMAAPVTVRVPDTLSEPELA